MFRASLFTIAKTWRQSKYPLTDEWLKIGYIYHKFTCTHIHTHIGILSSHKMSKMRPFPAKWIDLEFNILGEREIQIYDITCLWNI